MKYLSFALCLFLVACSSDDDSSPEPEVCTTEVVEGLRITVNNTSTGTGLEDVIVTARATNFSEILTADPLNVGVYSGVDERVGAYTLTIEKENFQTIITDAIVVVEDDKLCHVVTQERAYSLQPN